MTEIFHVRYGVAKTSSGRLWLYTVYADSMRARNWLIYNNIAGNVSFDKKTDADIACCCYNFMYDCSHTERS